MSEEKLQCGIVMPISSIDGCSESHWAEVLGIVSESARAAGFYGELVSNADEVGIIHKRIIQNLYENPIVVCDVSGKNPNVMFELGMRLAFDKPTIIIKDDKTTYSFDTSAIEHLEYPRDLRFSKIVDFKKKLSEKIKATYKNFSEDENYTTFLKHFGEFKIAKIDQAEVSGQEFIIEELKNLRRSMNRLEHNNRINNRSELDFSRSDIDICLEGVKPSLRDEIFEFVMNHPGLISYGAMQNDNGHIHLKAQAINSKDADKIKREIESTFLLSSGEVRGVLSGVNL
ncbi:hypothetical protein ACJJIX_11735 [Microbulbifer sp. VAAC004]|uniref:hypothetical protein n=1 Tax=unclassified Microbulbifer TaxID=2619833 RepID=UPI00403993B8